MQAIENNSGSNFGERVWREQLRPPVLCPAVNSSYTEQYTGNINQITSEMKTNTRNSEPIRLKINSILNRRLGALG